MSARTIALSMSAVGVAFAGMAYAAGLGGTWSGTVTQSDNNQSYTVEMELYGGRGTINYPSLRCGGNLLLASEHDKTVSYRESLTFGKDKCIDGGLVQLSPHPSGDPTMWNWRWDGSGVVVRGVLKGSGVRKE